MKDAPIYDQIREEREYWDAKEIPPTPQDAIRLLDLVNHPESPAWAIHALRTYLLKPPTLPEESRE